MDGVHHLLRGRFVALQAGGGDFGASGKFPFDKGTVVGVDGGGSDVVPGVGAGEFFARDKQGDGQEDDERRANQPKKPDIFIVVHGLFNRVAFGLAKTSGLA